ncbi:MAG: hypothetical protein ABUK01_16610 [Leptospirales bacterium]
MKLTGKLFGLAFVFLTFTSSVFTGDDGALEINGLLRNDAYVIKTSNPDDYQFHNVLENRLLFEAKRLDWKYYADARLYLYGGEIAALYGDYNVELMRGFVRYYSTVGDFTLGKTYVNFGNTGVFNPFEFDKSVNFADLGYAREGLLALEHYFSWQDTSGITTYVANTTPEELMWGVSPTVHLGTFDLGLVHNHVGPDNNISGAFFKGDLFVGVQGSWAVHSDDSYVPDYSEATVGLDYSFIDGDLLVSALYYYNEAGATSPSKYIATTESFLLARHYGLLSVVGSIDEFWSVQLSAFVNLIDYSAVIIPSTVIVLTSGLSLTLQVSFFTADGNEEFSTTRAGDLITMIRAEGKF